MTLTADLLPPLLSGSTAARPLITYYDDRTGERIELSAVTTANWAAKVANLLRDECDVEPGDRVAVLLPAHWQTAAVLLGAWWAGAEVVGDPLGADLVLCDAGRVDLALVAQPDRGVAALSLDPFGHGLSGLPDGVRDFATEVRLQPDEFVPDEPVPPGDPALAGRSVAEVLAAARERAAARGFTGADRVLSTLDWADPDDLIDGLLAVLVAGASLVQVRHPDADAMAARARAERTTATLP